MKLVILALFFEIVASWIPLDPEEALFAYTRCQEDFLNKALDPIRTHAEWVQWRLEPANDPATQCYVKCVLVRLGLFDPVEKAFKPERVEQQWRAYQSYNFIDETSVKALKNALQNVVNPPSDSCADVFVVYQPIHSAHLKAFQNVYHGLAQNTAKIYAKMGNTIRQKKQSYFVFCENKFYPQGATNRNELCRIRAYEILQNDRTYKQLLVCIFHGLRYLNENNQIDEAEIIRDFVQVGKSQDGIGNLMKNCRANAPTDGKNESTVLHYYKCLVTGSLEEDFKEAFNYRELRSEDYAYKLKPHTPSYSKAIVDARMVEIDDLQCPSSMK